jgi:hypothetical protein
VAWSAQNQPNLSMCFGGGNPSGRLAPMPVAVEKSFAMDFARICRVAKSITARTEVVTVDRRRRGPDGVPEDQLPVVEVWRTVGGRRKAQGLGIDKYVFEPQRDGSVSYGPA